MNRSYLRRTQQYKYKTVYHDKLWWDRALDLLIEIMHDD